MNNKVRYSENYRPWIETRFDPDTKPKHKVLSRQLHLSDEPTLPIHTAGQKIVWELSIREAAHDQELLEGMDESDRHLVHWIYENDYIVPHYNYRSCESSKSFHDNLD